MTGDVAVLESEPFNSGINGSKAHCMEFWYHMYGADIGSLLVYKKELSGKNPETLLWNITGQQQTSEKDAWAYGQVPINEDADHTVS